MKPKKSLGQNFLKSAEAIRKIVEVGEIAPNDVILEIGPGKGVLTEKILEKIETGELIAVEKDRELFEFLQEKFKTEIEKRKLILINEDILRFKTPSLFEHSPFAGGEKAPPCQGRGWGGSNYKIIANIPYNITGAILKKFLQGDLSIPLKAISQPERMVLMLQKEVAERILAKDGKESILSISVKAYGEPKMILKVPARYFSPAPKVDSAVISIKNISRKIFEENGVDETLFWRLIHAGFAHKRKKLQSNLKNLAPKTVLEQLKNKRAEELTLENWINLAKVANINKKQ